MSKEQEISDFIDKNQEAFKELHRIIKSIDTVRGVDSAQEFKARTMAIDMVNQWLTNLWGIAYPEIPKDDDEDEGIFRTITKS